MENPRSENLFTIPNLFTLLRILLSPVIFYLILINNIKCLNAAAILLGISVFTDFADGYFARKLSLESKIGKILDPIADKILIDGIAVCLVITRLFPVWMTVIIILRDLLIVLFGGILTLGKKKFIPQSNIFGKITFVFLALTMLAYIIEVPYSDIVQKILILSSLILLCLSGLIYLGIFLKKESKKSSLD